MKNSASRLFLLLTVVLCAVFAMALVTQATETEQTHSVCVCGGNLSDEAKTLSGHECNAVEWSPLNSENIADHFSISDGVYAQKVSESICILPRIWISAVIST